MSRADLGVRNHTGHVGRGHARGDRAAGDRTARGHAARDLGRHGLARGDRAAGDRTARDLGRHGAHGLSDHAGHDDPARRDTRPLGGLDALPEPRRAP